MGLMAGADERCSREDILAVPLPEATRTYRPVPNGLVLDMVEDEVTRVYGVSKDDMEVELAMSSDGQQMFGSLIVPEVYNERFQSALNIVFRNSYNKSINLAFGGGANCGICTNLQVFGSIQKMRKHTTNIFEDLGDMVHHVVLNSGEAFKGSMEMAERLQSMPISMDDSFRAIGLAMGRKVLMPRQASVAYSELRESTYEEFREENVWSLYNHFTEALKRGPVGDIMTRHEKATDFFRNEFALAA